jgi:hypothetical protein
MSKYTEKWVQARLWDYYYNTHKYLFHNICFFGSNEIDALHFLDNGHCWEFEIKVRKFDFFDDFEKEDKHKKLKAGVDCANRFYYVTPFDLIDVKDVPQYAGLIEVSEDRLRIKKRAPLLHSNLWNPALHFDRIYRRLKDFVNADMNGVLAEFKTKRNNKSSYKKKKYTPKPKHPPQEKFIKNIDTSNEDIGG